MQGSNYPSLILTVAVVALIAWRMYARIRRMVGRQRYSNVRPWITVVVFPLLIALLALGTRAFPQSALRSELALAGGVMVGLGLALYGLRVTKFEKTAEGLFYTPSAHVGVALSVLFVARIAFRFVQLSTMPALAAAAPPGANPYAAYSSGPLTMIIFGALAGYYTLYAVGLLRWRHGATASTTPDSPTAGTAS